MGRAPAPPISWRMRSASSPGSMTAHWAAASSMTRYVFSTNAPLGIGTIFTSVGRLQRGEVLLHRDRRGRGIAHRRRDLTRHLAADVAGGEQPRKRRHHLLLGHQVTGGIVLQVPPDPARVG